MYLIVYTILYLTLKSIYKLILKWRVINTLIIHIYLVYLCVYIELEKKHEKIFFIYLTRICLKNKRTKKELQKNGKGNLGYW